MSYSTSYSLRDGTRGQPFGVTPGEAETPLMAVLARPWMSYQKLRVLKHLMTKDFLWFVKAFHKEINQRPFIYNWHHAVICSALQQVAEQEIPRLIISCPPGFSKTELVNRMFAPYTIARFGNPKNLSLSYSADLAWQTSQEIKDVVESDLFQCNWPQQIRKDTRAKRAWKTLLNAVMVAGSTGGQVTGQRAGRLEEGFTGYLSIDDPIKPEDAIFPLIRDKMNQRFKSTIQSRLARPDTPIVLIMQRVHEDDLAGFLLKGGSGEKWHHLIIPAEIETEDPEYPEEYTHGIPIDYQAPLGYTWPLKVSGDYATALKEDPVIWATQYQQTPTADQGEIFDAQWWRHYEAYDPVNSEVVLDGGDRVRINYKGIYADTAMKTQERHDWSVFQLWAKLADGNIALLDQERGKWEAPELRERFLKFHERHKFQHGVNNMGVRHVKVEDKSSGTGLIQELNKTVNWIEGIPRDKDKVSRAKSVAPQIKLGRVLLPRGAPWLSLYVREFQRFNSMMTHAHDDQIDPTADAIMDMIITERQLSYKEVVDG